MFSFENFPSSVFDLLEEKRDINGLDDFYAPLCSDPNPIEVRDLSILSVVVERIIAKSTIVTITSVFTNEYYNSIKDTIFKYNRHLYCKTIKNFHKTSEEIEQSIKLKIDENKERMLNLIGGETGILQVIDSYTVPYDDILKLLLEDTSEDIFPDRMIKKIFMSNNIPIYSFGFLKHFMEKYIFNLEKSQKILFLKNYIKNIIITTEMYDFLLTNEVFSELHEDVILELLKRKNLPEEKIIELLNVTRLSSNNIIELLKVIKFSEQTLLVLSFGQDSSYWYSVVKTQDLTEDFVIENDTNININLYSKNRQLSENFVRLYSDVIDWNSVLKNNTYTKSFLKEYQFDLLYYLYTLSKNDVLVSNVVNTD